MKHLIAIALLAIPVASAAEDCPWSGGEFRGQEGPFRAHFTVNAACSEMNFESVGNTGIQEPDVMQSFALAEEKHGWVADINGVNATLANHGGYVNFMGEGTNLRLQVRPVE